MCSLGSLQQYHLFLKLQKMWTPGDPAPQILGGELCHASLLVHIQPLNRGGGKMVIRQTDVLRNRSARTVVGHAGVP